MRRIEKMDLLDRIGRELQSRWSYSGINDYLKAWGVDTTKETSNVNSKWIYSKELLADESDDLLLKIANELEIEHGYVVAGGTDIKNVTFWKPGYFRLFLSHTSKNKVKVSLLQKNLLDYGISGFVAHEDIEPTKEWLLEIEKALLSMDALAAVLTEDFNKSNWTDQEVGFAVGRDVLILPIRKGLDPYGFISRYQGLQANGLTVREVAKATFKIISSNQKTRGKYADTLVKLILKESNTEKMLHWIILLKSVEGVPKPSLEQLQANATENDIIAKDPELIDSVNGLLSHFGLEPLVKSIEEVNIFDDDIPF